MCYDKILLGCGQSFADPSYKILFIITLHLSFLHCQKDLYSLVIRRDGA
jgi:hypothetical protein